MDRVVVVLAASRDVVAVFAREFEKRDDVELYIIANRRDKDLLSCLDNVLYVDGMINRRNISFGRALLRLRPREVLVVCGERYWHDNIVDAVKFYAQVGLFPVIQISAWAGGKVFSCGCRAWYSACALFAVGIVFMLSIVSLMYFVGCIAALYFFISFVVIEIVSMFIVKYKSYFGFVDYCHDVSFRKEEFCIVKKMNDIVFACQCDSTKYGHVPARGKKQKIVAEVEALSLKREYSCAVSSFGYREGRAGGRESNGKIISIYGCSFTFGALLNDDETYPAQLQSLMPGDIVLNHGVNGSSPWQNYLRMQEDILTENPDVVVFGFWTGLENRNVIQMFSDVGAVGIRRNKAPTCRLRKGALKGVAPAVYEAIPFSGAFNILLMVELAYNRMRFPLVEQTMIRKINKEVLLQMKKKCEERGIKFLVCCLLGSLEYHDFFSKNGFNWCVSDVDFHTFYESKMWTYFPLDGHPTPETCTHYASLIFDSIEAIRRGSRVVPPVSKIFVRKSEELGDSADGFIYNGIY